MSKSYKFYQPNWYRGEPPKGSYRSVFKWGDITRSDILDEHLFIFLKEKYGLLNEDFVRQKLGLEQIPDLKVVSKEKQGKLKKLFGEKVSFSAYDRVSSAYGKSILDINGLRMNIADKLPIAVIFPETEEDIANTFLYAKENELKVYVGGGKTSADNESSAADGKLALDLRRMNKVLEFNELDQLITVQSGITGADLELVLSEAPENFDVNKRYTVGFRPSSFEMSTVGGWIATGAKSNESGYYGNIYDIVESFRVIMSDGRVVDTNDYFGVSGFDFGNLFFASDGAFGVISAVTLKIFRDVSYNNASFAIGFKDFASAQQAGRNIAQLQQVAPASMRLSDADETAFLMGSKGLNNGLYGLLFRLKSLKRGETCILMGTIKGTRAEITAVKRAVARSRRRFKGKNLYGVSQKFFASDDVCAPYIRETLQDFGFASGFIESFAAYSEMPKIHALVKEYLDANSTDVIGMTRLTHFEKHGAGLKIVYVMQINGGTKFADFENGLKNVLRGAGVLVEPFGGYLDVKKSLKKYFDGQGSLD